MTVKELCFAYANGQNEGKSSSMHICDGCLFSYDTCIAQRTGKNKYIVNNTRYSVTTSKQQHYLRVALSEVGAKVKYLEGLPKGTFRLK